MQSYDLAKAHPRNIVYKYFVRVMGPHSPLDMSTMRRGSWLPSEHVSEGRCAVSHSQQLFRSDALLSRLFFLISPLVYPPVQSNDDWYGKEAYADEHDG